MCINKTQAQSHMHMHAQTQLTCCVLAGYLSIRSSPILRGPLFHAKTHSPPSPLFRSSMPTFPFLVTRLMVRAYGPEKRESVLATQNSVSRPSLCCPMNVPCPPPASPTLRPCIGQSRGCLFRTRAGPTRSAKRRSWTQVTSPRCVPVGTFLFLALFFCSFRRP